MSPATSAPNPTSRPDHFEWEGGTANRRARTGGANPAPRQASQSAAEETWSSGLERRYASIKAPARTIVPASPKPGSPRGN
jgi:hypothetical protein